MKIKYRFLLLILGMSSLSLNAIDYTIHINKGSVIQSELEVSFCSFNTDEVFTPKNIILTANSEEVIQLTINNNDTLDHTFTIDGIVDELIESESSITFDFAVTEIGTYRYYSNFSYGQKAGASGILLIGYQEYPTFFWNLFDAEHLLSEQLAGNTVSEIPLDYQPELFYINGASYPETLDDPNTSIEMAENESVIISIVNSGNMEHVLHFHGFHVEILDVKMHTIYKDWIKDTLPLDCGEQMTVLLTVDKPGIYPVHDHNLIAVTNIGFYPGGMLTQIVVSE